MDFRSRFGRIFLFVTSHIVSKLFLKYKNYMKHIANTIMSPYTVYAVCDRTKITRPEWIFCINKIWGRAPAGASSVRFAVWSNSVIGYGTVTITKSGQFVGSDVTWTLPFYSGVAEFPVSSGGTYTVTIRVSSSGGGQYGYNFR